MRPSLVVLLGCAAALAVPASASALIQIDRGIAGARLNNTKTQVRTALGTPDRIVHGTNDFGAFTQYRYDGGIVVGFQSGDKVTGVSTSGHGDRTTRNVGVGSSEATVVAKVPGIHCETIGSTRECHTNTLTAGQRVTDFLMRNGHVRRVTVAFVVD